MNKEKDNIKSVKAGLIISCIAVIISSINVIYASMNGLQIASSITIFCCTITIMCVNIYSFNKRKKQKDISIKFPCPVCEKYEFGEEGDYDICNVCGWENDNVQYRNHDYWGGANELSVNESKIEYTLLNNKSTKSIVEDLMQKHKNALKNIYIKYKDINYLIEGEKISNELRQEHDKYISELKSL